MGSSSSAKDLSRKFDRLGRTFPDATRKGVSAAALHGKSIALAEMSASGLRPGKPLSGDRRKRKVNARYDIVGGQKSPTALLRIVGPAHWMNAGTKPHNITPRGRQRRLVQRRMNAAAMFGAMSGQDAPGIGGGRGSIRGVLAFPKAGRGKGFSRYVRHPGIRGKRFWPRVEKRVAETAPRLVASEVKSGIGSVFK